MLFQQRSRSAYSGRVEVSYCCILIENDGVVVPPSFKYVVYCLVSMTNHFYRGDPSTCIKMIMEAADRGLPLVFHYVYIRNISK